MALSPKDIISGVVDRGRKVVSEATGRFRRHHEDETPATQTATPEAPTRAGGTKTGAPTPSSTRTARARAAGTSTRKPAGRKAAPKAGAKNAPKSATAKPTGE